MAQIKAAIKKLDEKIHKLDLKRTEKDELKTIALGTSKINYIDPRVTVAWCKRFNVPVEKVPPASHSPSRFVCLTATQIFSKSLREKFPWAMEVDADFKF
jgi:DNA topoisomerase-1